jgi:hypothetical protein
MTAVRRIPEPFLVCPAHSVERQDSRGLGETCPMDTGFRRPVGTGNPAYALSVSVADREQRASVSVAGDFILGRDRVEADLDAPLSAASGDPVARETTPPTPASEQTARRLKDDA